MVDYFDEITKLVGHDVAKVAEDGTIADNTEYLDTGCYTLNVALSGSLFGGAPTNKVVGFAAAEAVGKSFLIIQVMKSFLEKNPKGRVIYNDTEGRIDKPMLALRGVDTSRVLMLYPETIEEFKNMNYKIIANYREKTKKDKIPLFMVCDSLTQLPSEKQRSDSEADKSAGDMGSRAKIWRGAWQVLRQPLSKAKIPMFCTNHTYQTTGLFPTTEVAGGGGFKYAADIILALVKYKDTDKKTNVVQGSVIKMKVAKGWNVKQHSEFKAYLSYTTGLDRYYGLHELAIEAKIFDKSLMPDLIKKPKEHFTDAVLNQIEAFIKDRYCFSQNCDLESLDALADLDSEE